MEEADENRDRRPNFPHRHPRTVATKAMVEQPDLSPLVAQILKR
jgi:hypothetical protein